MASPPDYVLSAFGEAGCTPTPLGGGQGTSWRAGDLVFKPIDVGPDELAWQARIYPQISRDGFRLSQPRATSHGALCVDGWCAAQYQAGRHRQRRWAEIIAVGARFHAALARDRAAAIPGYAIHPVGDQ